MWAPEYREFDKRLGHHVKKELKARRSSLLSALEEFANLRSNELQWRAFRKQWPDFFPSWMYDEVDGSKQPVLIHEFERPADGPAATLDAHPEFVGALWEDPQPHTILNMLLGIQRPPLPNEVDNHEDAFLSRIAFIPAHWFINWDNGELIYLGGCDFQKALYLLSRESWRAKICAKCKFRFIAKRAPQRYCSTDCSELVQQELKRAWWAKHGKRWRDSQSDDRDRAQKSEGKGKHGSEETR